MKKRNLIGILILVLMIIIGGVFMFQKKNTTTNKENQSRQNNDKVVDTENFTNGYYKFENVDTTKWLVFKNDKYGFEFRYPNDWVINKDSSNEGEKYLAIEFNQKNAKIVPEGLKEGSIGIYVSTDKNKETAFKEVKDLKKKNNVLIWRTTIDGYDGYYIGGSGEGLKMNTNKYYFSIMSSLSSEKTAFDDQVRTALNGMIQTLHFTN